MKYEYEALVKRYFQRRRTEVLREEPPQCHYVHCKYHEEWPTIKPRPPG
jgi:hypothetical protein